MVQKFNKVFLFPPTPKNNILQCCFRNLGAPFKYIRLFVEEHGLKPWDWISKFVLKKRPNTGAFPSKINLWLKSHPDQSLYFNKGKNILGIFIWSRVSRNSSSFGCMSSAMLAVAWSQTFSGKIMQKLEKDP